MSLAFEERFPICTAAPDWSMVLMVALVMGVPIER
jgi:hypothetical protein